MSEHGYVSLRGLTLSYGDTVAVDGLDLDIQKGELLALLGPSGCGKTTTMRALAGLLAPRSGMVLIDGRDVTKVAANKRGVGLVFQSYALFPHLTAFENVAFGLRIRGVGKKELERTVLDGLQTVGLASFKDRKPSELSGGQQQRLSLVRSLVLDPKLLLLDEPLSNLDARLRLEMRSELQRLQRARGMTMVFVTHDQAEALALADRVVLMRDGKIEQQGPPEQLYANPGTPFAADFFGFENLFEVKDGHLLGRKGPMRASFDTSELAHVGWRANGVRVGQTGMYTGKVVVVSFAGESREYVIESDLGTVKAETRVSDTVLAMGQEVGFDLPQETALALSGNRA